MRFYYLLLFFWLSFSLQAKEFQTHSKVCANPNQTCQTEVYDFQAHELSFKLPKQLEWQSGYYSAEFYAVLFNINLINISK